MLGDFKVLVAQATPAPLLQPVCAGKHQHNQKLCLRCPRIISSPCLEGDRAGDGHGLLSQPRQIAQPALPTSPLPGEDLGSARRHQQRCMVQVLIWAACKSPAAAERLGEAHQLSAEAPDAVITNAFSTGQGGNQFHNKSSPFSNMNPFICQADLPNAIRG